jgi:hypothetical protein
MSEQYPPSLPGAIAPLVESPAWPKVIGILSLVWACLGLTCGACGVGWMLVGPALMPPDMRAQMPPNLMGTPAMWVNMTLSMINTVLLLVAGVVTLRRHAAGRLLHLGWAVIAIVLWGAGVYLQIGQQEALKQWAAQNPDTPFARQMNSLGSQIGQMAGMVIGAIFGLAYPVFLLIWFGAVKRSHKDWGSPPEEAREVV